MGVRGSYQLLCKVKKGDPKGDEEYEGTKAGAVEARSHLRSDQEQTA